MPKSNMPPKKKKNQTKKKTEQIGSGMGLHLK